ncbi:MAG TPA: glutaredoxin 3, partial [Gammaproteobacteria bacterium]|nr:glutaredoxin 3 [Gammaproteobacteria bacterium]
MGAPNIIVYTSAFCPYCTWAKKLLDVKDAKYDEIRIDQDSIEADLMVKKSGRTSVPQIFIGDHHVGGYDDLAAMDKAGDLD